MATTEKQRLHAAAARLEALLVLLIDADMHVGECGTAGGTEATCRGLVHVCEREWSMENLDLSARALAIHAGASRNFDRWVQKTLTASVSNAGRFVQELFSAEVSA